MNNTTALKVSGHQWHMNFSFILNWLKEVTGPSMMMKTGENYPTGRHDKYVGAIIKSWANNVCTENYI